MVAYGIPPGVSNELSAAGLPEDLVVLARVRDASIDVTGRVAVARGR
jgi:hypothetical protein